MTKKKNNKYKREILTNTSYSNEITNIVKVVIVIAILFVMMYLLTIFLVNKGKKDSIKSNIKESYIQYDKILAGNSLTVSDGEYLVVFYDMSAVDASTYGNLIASYQDNYSDKKIYYVNLNDNFNKKFISEESNLNINNINDLRVNGPSIIKVVDHKVESFAEGQTAVTEFLK